ncbi:DEAD/DEAH box helicase family protein [Mycoplasma sp. 1578d]|uniref:DEAD/DEAH box helicase n=1 Tax=Mycoplasma sp. 1578d TaxID=2967299 RepID=UPI00211CCA89|nr:DEAD/DEAH box helicase family protein [Mycoplasma sp. 1578d]UUM20034.1 DEAD/DEAH box helicase family protein [Mycoplasma sp. 1578d]
MSFILSKVQREAVDQIYHFWKNRHQDPKNRKVIFKAPTGSGKTFMIAKLIDKILINNHNDKKIFFLIATLSSAELPLQFANKLEEYKIGLVNDNLSIVNIQSPSKSETKSNKDYNFNLTYKNCDVMIVGKSSFGEGRIFTDYGILDGMLNSIKNDDEVELIYIRDEAHIGTIKKRSAKKKKITNDEEISKNFEDSVNSIASFSIQMTATPQDDENLVEITEEALLRDDSLQLLKRRLHFNVNLDTSDDVDDEKLLRKACQKFKEIKKQYGSKKEEKLVGINPAMLIQIRNKKNDSDSEIDEELQQNINKYIQIIESEGLQWATYFSDSKYSTKSREEITLKNLSANNSSIDVILFKVGPATGWDIPRACMLVQLRKIFSSTLNTQTIGRIKRNPNPNGQLPINSIGNDYFIYSNVDSKINQSIFYWKLKEEVKKYQYKIFTGRVETKKVISNFDKVNYEKYLNEIISIKKIKTALAELDQYYESNQFLIGREGVFIKSKTERVPYIDSKIYNKIELRLFVNELREINKKYFVPLGENYLYKRFAQISSIINEEYFSQDLFEYIVYKKLLNLIIEKAKHYHKNTNIEGQYSIDIKEIPENFVQIYKAENQNKYPIKGNMELKFAYDPKKHKNLLLDSASEKMFLEHLKSWLNFKNNPGKNLTLWNRNDSSIGVSYEYLAKNQHDNIVQLKQSFPDLYLIINQVHIVIIEIKAYQNDIDEQKTDYLLNAYKKYVQSFIKQEKMNLFPEYNLNQSLTMLVCYPITKSFIQVKGYSSIETLANFLKTPESESTTLRRIVEVILNQKNEK